MPHRSVLPALTVLALAALPAGCAAGGGGRSTGAPAFVVPSAAPGTGGPATPSGRPSATAPSGTPSATPSRTPSARPSRTSTPPRTPPRYAFPVRAGNVAFHPTHSKYPGTDIFADCGEPVVATTDGTVLEVSRTDAYVEGRPDGPLNGGLSVSLLGDDGVRYYGSHLSRIQSGVDAGVRVRRGQQLGRVGRTGNANGVCHLHYGISPPCARTGDWKVRRGVVWPAEYLRSWRSGGHRSPVAAVTAWRRTHDCRA